MKPVPPKPALSSQNAVQATLQLYDVILPLLIAVIAFVFFYVSGSTGQGLLAEGLPTRVNSPTDSPHEVVPSAPPKPTQFNLGPCALHQTTLRNH